MADVYTTIGSSDVSVIGGPSKIDVSVDYGVKGDRGSYFLYGNGKPSEVTLPESPKIFDMFINLNPNDSEYQFVYQYISQPGGPGWVALFKIVPDVYTAAKTLTFTDGSATTYISAASIVGSNTRAASLTSSNYAVNVTVSGTYPVAASVSVGATVQDSQGIISVPITITGVQRNGNNTWSNLSGERLVYFHISVV